MSALLTLFGIALQSLGPAPTDTVRLVFVRHGQAFSNLVPLPILPKEKLDHLTPIGIAEATDVGHALRDLSPVIIFSSPAGRARETSRVLAEAMGRAENFTLAPALAPLASTHPDQLDASARRVESLARELLIQYAGKAVVLVAHAEVIAAFLGAVEGLSPEQRWPRALAYASVTVIDFGAQPRVRVINWKAKPVREQNRNPR
jgi:broad specificity phosphatase PhoE